MKKSLLVGTLSAIIIFGGVSVNAQNYKNNASARRIVNDCPNDCLGLHANEDCPRFRNKTQKNNGNSDNMPKRNGVANMNGTGKSDCDGIPRKDGTGNKNGSLKRNGSGNHDCDGTQQGRRNKQS